MSLKTQLNELLNTEMDRKNFIKNVAIGVVALTGFGAALRLISQEPSKTNTNNVGYNGATYGGDADGKQLG